MNPYLSWERLQLWLRKPLKTGTLHDFTFSTGFLGRCGSSKHNGDPLVMRPVSSDHNWINWCSTIVAHRKLHQIGHVSSISLRYQSNFHSILMINPWNCGWVPYVSPPVDQERVSIHRAATGGSRMWRTFKAAQVCASGEALGKNWNLCPNGARGPLRIGQKKNPFKEVIIMVYQSYIYIYANGWMAGWMAGWMDGWTDRWIDR